MARIRTIKPEFWSSPDTSACEDPWARLLFVAMWNWADDCGRGTANARELGGFAFPNDEWISNDDIRRMLGGIRRAFGVKFYKVEGRPYYAIPSWDKHQKIDKRSGAKYPAPEDGEEWDPEPTPPPDLAKRNGSRYPAEPSAEPAESTPNPRRTPGAGTGEQGNRGERTPSLAPLAATDRFDDFWAVYPRRVEKRAAEKAWRAALNRKAIPEQIISAAKAYAARTRDTEPRFIKHPASWLNAGAYEDEHNSRPAQVSSSFEELRFRADAKEAARLLGIACVLREQPPSDKTPPRQWLHDRAVEWIDAHERELREALTERKTG